VTSALQQDASAPPAVLLPRCLCTRVCVRLLLTLAHRPCSVRHDGQTRKAQQLAYVFAHGGKRERERASSGCCRWTRIEAGHSVRQAHKRADEGKSKHRQGKSKHCHRAATAPAHTPSWDRIGLRAACHTSEANNAAKQEAGQTQPGHAGRYSNAQFAAAASATNSCNSSSKRSVSLSGWKVGCGKRCAARLRGRMSSTLIELGITHPLSCLSITLAGSTAPDSHLPHSHDKEGGYNREVL